MITIIPLSLCFPSLLSLVVSPLHSNTSEAEIATVHEGKEDPLHVTIKSVKLNALNSSIGNCEYCFVSFHSADSEGKLQKVLFITDPRPVSECVEWILPPATILVPSQFDVVAVLCTDTDGPVAYARVEIDRDLEISDIESQWTFSKPVFSLPTVSLTVACKSKARISFIPGSIVVGASDSFGALVPSLQRKEYRITLAVSGIGEEDTTAVSEACKIDLVGTGFVVRCKSPLVVETYAGSVDLAGIRVTLSWHDESNPDQPTIIQRMSLAAVRFNSPTLVGRNCEGFLVNAKVGSVGTCRYPLISELAALMPKHIARVDMASFKISVSGLPPFPVPGSVSYGLVGYGMDLCCSVDDWSTVDIQNASSTVEWEYNTRICDSQPILGIVVRDREQECVGIYTVPLKPSTTAFGTDSVFITIKMSDRTVNDPMYLPIPDQLATVSFPTNSNVRVYCTVESALLPETACSVFVSVRVVTCPVNPCMLTADEVFRLQSGDCANTEWAITNTREKTSTPTWFHDMFVDRKNATCNDYLYFLVYDSIGVSPDEPPSLIGRACIPVNSLTSDGPKPISLPLMHSDLFKQIGDNTHLKISVPRNPAVWSPVVIRQSAPLSSELHDGQVCLKVVISHDKRGMQIVAENHMWLPIKNVHPLSFLACPPSGFATLTLSALDGKVLASSRTPFTTRCNDNVTCGGIKFSLARDINACIS